MRQKRLIWEKNWTFYDNWKVYEVVKASTKSPSSTVIPTSEPTAQPIIERAADTSPAATTTVSPENNVQASNNGWMSLVGIVVAMIVLAGGAFVVRGRDGGVD